MLLGEAPGYHESRKGVPFVGRSGEMVNAILYHYGLDRSNFYITNTVKYRPDYKNSDPSPEDIARDWGALEAEFRRVDPDLVICLGKIGFHTITGIKKPMDTVHGRLFVRKVFGRKRRIIPSFHPAAALRSTAMAQKAWWDFEQAAKWMKFSGEIGEIADDFPRPTYRLATRSDLPRSGQTVYVDTEGTPTRPWGLSFSVRAGEGFIILAGDPLLGEFAKACRRCSVVVHNLLWDYQVLLALGVRLGWGRLTDSMVRAYALQVEPQGLKPLAYRHAAMKMTDYKKAVAPYLESAREDFLIAAREKLEDDSIPAKRIDACLKAIMKGDGKTSASKRMKGWEKPGVAAEIREAVPELQWPDESEAIHLLPVDVAVQYAGRDPDATLRVDQGYLIPQIKRMRLEETVRLDMSAMPLVEEMQRVGMKVDLKRVRKLRKELLKAKQEAVFAMWDLLGDTNFSPASPPQVAMALRQMRAPMVRKTKGGADSTDDKALSGIKLGIKKREEQGFAKPSDKMLLAFIELLEQYREVAKCENTFVSPLLDLVSSDGRLHPRFGATSREEAGGTVTGRYTMQKPNLLAFPAHSKWGKRVRSCFVASPGMEMFTVDMSQVEMRVMADLSGDATLIEFLLSGKDIHSQTAKRIFNLSCDVDDVKALHPDKRNAAKRINFGIMYGLMAEGLWDQLVMMDGMEVTLAECQAMIDGWFALFPGVKRFLSMMALEARKNGFVREPYAGRLRYLQNVWSGTWLQHEARRQAGNHPIQAGATTLVKRAMAKVWGSALPKLRKMGKVSILLQIHDELIGECDRAIKDEVGRVMLETMVAGLDNMKVPFTANIAWGPDWGELEK